MITLLHSEGNPKTATVSTLNFFTFRDYHTKLDNEKGRSLYIGLFDAKDLIKVSNSNNVRDYLKVSRNGENLTSSGVHSQIYNTLENSPEDFYYLNGGITICADGIDIDNNNRQVHLKNASIINGAQTNGVLKTFLKKHKDVEIKVKVEIIVVLSRFSENKDLTDDISIARNQQNAVKAISIVGKKGLLDKLDSVTSISLQKNESQKDSFDTLKLIQLIFTAMPLDVWSQTFKNVEFNKAKVYTSKQTWLKKFSEIEDTTKLDPNVQQYFYDVADDVLQFYLNIKADKYKITKFLKCNSVSKVGYKITEDKKVEIQDGWIFPILSILSITIKKDEYGYKFEEPSANLVKSITKIILENSGIKEHCNVQTLGKSTMSYASPLTIAKLLHANGELEDYCDK